MFLPPSPPSIAAPAADGFSLQPPTLSPWILPYPPRSARAPQKPRLLRQLAQPTPSKSSTEGPPPARPPARPRPPPPRLALRCPRRSRLRTASPLGRADVQQQQLAMHPLLSTMALSPAGSLDHLSGVLTPRRESYGRGRPRPPPRPLVLLPRQSSRYQSRPTATARSLSEPLFYGLRLLLVIRRLHLHS